MALTPLLCLTLAIYHEARGEPLEGQYAVGQVVLNRVADDRYKDTVCEVVFKDYQFSFTSNSDLTMYNSSARKIAEEVASDLLNNVTYPISSTHYHSVNVSPFWVDVFEEDVTIGSHVFYTNTTDYR